MYDHYLNTNEYHIIKNDPNQIQQDCSHRKQAI